MVKKYIPKRGDICFVDFNPAKGHEQKGYRPCLVISNNEYNEFTKMALVCPITSNIKSFPTHYSLKKSQKISGAVLCEHVRSIDYEERNFKFIEKIDVNDMREVIYILLDILEINNFVVS